MRDHKKYNAVHKVYNQIDPPLRWSRRRRRRVRVDRYYVVFRLRRGQFLDHLL